ncbi:MAG: GDSL-type esterase/lipase family protein [Sandaracinaceae bacterium]
MQIALLAACFRWIPYAVPGLEELQVVGPHDDWPLTDLLSATPRQGGAGLAGALREDRDLGLDDDDEALLEAAPLPPPVEVRPRPSRPSRRPRPPRSPNEATPAVPEPPPRVEPAQYEGLTREIEDPHESMRMFYRRLARVANGEHVLARMSVYGTSTNGADRMTSQLRRLLQRRFGDGGKGWVPVAPGWRYQRHQDVEWAADGWDTFVVNRGDGPLDRYGYGGVVALHGDEDAESRFGTTGDAPGSRVGVYRLFYQAFPEGRSVELQVDEGAPRSLDTHADVVEDRVETIEVADGSHVLSIRAPATESPPAEGDLRLYGVTMERDGPGVVVDGLALIGAFTRVLRLFDHDHLETQIQQRDPDLVVFWMGANDAVSDSVAYVPSRYEQHYRGILRRYRAANPEMSCLVMSVLDKGQRVNGHIVTRPRVPRLVQAQREIAEAEGCAFFDTFMAMGGEGTMARWYANRPRLVTDDLGHLTASGSRIMGTLLYRAILKGYDDWIAAGAP